MDNLADLESQIRQLDEGLRPIAQRKVDLTNPHWMKALKQRQHPFDESGLRSVAEPLLENLIARYQGPEETQRKAIREMFVHYTSFSWAASLPFAPTTEDSFRSHLILFSMSDQGMDTRDAILTLQGLCKTARSAGVSLEAILRQVAQLSSDEDKYGMGSTKGLLLGAI